MHAEKLRNLAKMLIITADRLDTGELHQRQGDIDIEIKCSAKPIPPNVDGWLCCEPGDVSLSIKSDVLYVTK